tara:strand:- start:328 stop:588 length:261 start_codon:yes stop_codon:yes gene_type:complete
MLAGLIKFIFWFFFISYLIKVIARIFAPLLMKRFANKMQENFQRKYQNTQNPPQEEGKVTLEKTKPSAPIKSDDVGDYVDFEEVEE